jgi:hypothetical protein
MRIAEVLVPATAGGAFQVKVRHEVACVEWMLLERGSAVSPMTG